MVNRLAQHQIVRIVERVAGGKTFPDEVMHQNRAEQMAFHYLSRKLRNLFLNRTAHAVDGTTNSQGLCSR